jgi:hypothetical protein
METTNPLDGLIGTEVIGSEWQKYYVILSLKDGRKLRIERTADDCCSWIELRNVNTRPGIITDAKFENTDDDEGLYTAWIHVVTEDGAYRLAEADADASSGYYLHGFALSVTLVES